MVAQVCIPAFWVLASPDLWWKLCPSGQPNVTVLRKAQWPSETLEPQVCRNPPHLSLSEPQLYTFHYGLNCGPQKDKFKSSFWYLWCNLIWTYDLHGCDQMKRRSCWSRVGPTAVTGVLIKRSLNTETPIKERGWWHRKRLNWYIYKPRDPKDCQQPAEVRRGVQSRIPPPEGINPCWHLDVTPLASRTERTNFLLKPPGYLAPGNENTSCSQAYPGVAWGCQWFPEARGYWWLKGRQTLNEKGLVPSHHNKDSPRNARRAALPKPQRK
jgi:hypothetical protein